MIIQLKNVVKQYNVDSSEDKRVVLNDLSVGIDQGDALSIVGPSGSGKSTLLNMLGTLDKPTSGEVFVQDTNVLDLSDEELASVRNESIGFIFQMHHLLPQLNLYENVMLPTLMVKDKSVVEQREKRVKELLEMVGLQDKMKQRPGQLSGGECQRVAVVRALVNEPRVILADEPTGSLDHESAANLGELLKEINKKEKVALVIVTHSLSLAEKMPVRYELTKGKLKQISD